jgi:membrane-bound serine protease (ClpP class)
MTALGIALVIVGVVLLAAEAHLPTAGALGVGGIVALAGGGVMVAVASGLGLALALPVAAGVGVVAIGLLLLATGKAARAGRLPVRSGAARVVGHVGIIRAPLSPVGKVMVDGELWRARRAWDPDVDGPLEEGERVVVEDVDGLTVSVRKAEEWELSP